jgi:hypothetical protein
MKKLSALFLGFLLEFTMLSAFSIQLQYAAFAG